MTSEVRQHPHSKSEKKYWFSGFLNGTWNVWWILSSVCLANVTQELWFIYERKITRIVYYFSWNDTWRESRDTHAHEWFRCHNPILAKGKQATNVCGSLRDRQTLDYSHVPYTNISTKGILLMKTIFRKRHIERQSLLIKQYAHLSLIHTYMLEPNLLL